MFKGQYFVILGAFHRSKLLHDKIRMTTYTSGTMSHTIRTIKTRTRKRGENELKNQIIPKWDES